ncbi:MAG TPA: DUF1761 domain-containing protein [Candidatus Paceibacterota bacterium]|nr:DUF1761 domain-containing protein [Candidatus Paceibacterota bacterium]
MFFQHINYLTVVIAAVVSMGVGFSWYSPALFGKRWMKEMGTSEAEAEEYRKKMTSADKARMYGAPLLMALLNAFVVAVLLNSLVVTSIAGMAVFAFFVWLGFSMPVAANNAVFGKDSPVLFAINAGYQLVNILLASLIIGIWG